MSAFRDENFLPNTFQEITPNVSGNFAQTNRVRLTSQNFETSIDFPIMGIVINKNPIKPGGANIGPIEEFIDNSIDYFSRVLKCFPRKGTRLSVVTTNIMPEMSESKLQHIFKHIISPSPFYVANQPTEWKFGLDSRIPLKIKGKNEIINVLTSMNLIKEKASINPQLQNILPNNRVLVQIDINTFQGKIDPRFDSRSIKEFYKKSVELRQNILSEWEDYLNGTSK
jgi:hypothetical protein